MSDLRKLLHALADELANRLDAERVGDSEYYDQETSPLPSATHCKLVRKGKLPGFKLHGRVLVKKTDMHAYIEEHQVEPVPDVEDGEDAMVAGALSKLGLGGGSRAA